MHSELPASLPRLKRTQFGRGRRSNHDRPVPADGAPTAGGNNSSVDLSKSLPSRSISDADSVGSFCEPYSNSGEHFHRTGGYISQQWASFSGGGREQVGPSRSSP